METREGGLFSEEQRYQAAILEQTDHGGRFKKSRTHFMESEEKVATFETTPFHSVTRIHKKKNNSAWVKVNNKAVDDKKKQQHVNLTILAGEIYRFEIGPSQPKYRAVVEGDKHHIISRELIEAKEFFKFYKDHIFDDVSIPRTSPARPVGYTKANFFEGMGRVVVAKLIYDEDDMHFANTFLDKDNYFVGIDQDRTFWPVACKFFLFDPNKRYIAYQPLDPNLAHSKEILQSQVWYLLKDKKLDYIGDLSVEDYENLPIIKDHVPSNWEFLKDFIEPYTRKLAKDKLFNNEKHFQAIKILTTAFMKDFLVTVHMHGENADEVRALIVERIQKLSAICEASLSFQQYVAQDKTILIKVIIYEFHEFFLNNKHYLVKDETMQNNGWRSIVNELLKNYDGLLARWHFSKLTQDEVVAILNFSQHILTFKMEAMNEVLKFYLDQGMLLRAKNAALIQPDAAASQNPGRNPFSFFAARPLVGSVSAPESILEAGQKTPAKGQLSFP